MTGSLADGVLADAILIPAYPPIGVRKKLISQKTFTSK